MFSNQQDNQEIQRKYRENTEKKKNLRKITVSSNWEIICFTLSFLHPLKHILFFPHYIALV